MENTRVILENGLETLVNGIFYVFNSRYYFIYTSGEVVDSDYIQLYVVQVCKEVKNTENGPVDTGYMIGMETSDTEEWIKVQQSITKIVEIKKSGVIDQEIQFLPINMLINLKIVSKNKFKLMINLLVEAFNYKYEQSDINSPDSYLDNSLQSQYSDGINQTNISDVYQSNIAEINNSNNENLIVDYRAKFFEEQDKNKQLEEQLNILREKLDSIKSII